MRPLKGIALAALLCLGATAAGAKLTTDAGPVALPVQSPAKIDLAQVECRFTGVWISGDEKTCYYICAGSRETRKVQTGDLCPEHITKQ